MGELSYKDHEYNVDWKIPKRLFKNLVYFIPISMAIGYLFVTAVAQYRFYSIKNEIKTNNDPTSLADYNIPDVPIEQNGAFLIEYALNSHVRSDDYINLYERMTGEWVSMDDDFGFNQLKADPIKQVTIKSWISANKMSFDRLKKGISINKQLFNREYKSLDTWDYYDFILRNTIEMRDFLKYMIYISIINNNKIQAFENFSLLVDFGLVTKNDLTWEYYIDLWRAYKTAIESLYYIVENLELTDDEINFLYMELQRLYNALDIKELLIQQRAFYLDYTHLINEDPLEIIYYSYFGILDYVPYFSIKLDMMKTVEILGQLIEMVDKPYYEIENELNKMIVETNNAHKFWGFTKDHNQLNIFRDHFKVNALNRIIHTTLAIKKFKLQFGRFPNGLYELIGVGLINTMPTSPFTGQELIYEISNGRYRLFCPGSNGAYFRSVCGCDEYDTSPRDDIEWDFNEDEDNDE